MSLEPLLAGLFDYAGMFPPAALPFDEALATTAKFPKNLRRAGLVGNDIVLTPAALGQLDDAALEAADYRDRPLRICLVGVPLDDAEDQAHAVVAFNEERRHATVPQSITCMEIHGTNLDGAATVLRNVRRTIGSVALYFEPKWDDARTAQELPDVAGLLHGLQSDGAAIGLKVRCDGPTALGHATLANVIVEANARRLPLKLTQGLHHPFANGRHGNVHGFLNVIAALRLQRVFRWSTEETAACLADDEPANFAWDEGLGWRDHRALMQQVMLAAAAVPFAIGSCSIAEPDDDLTALD